MKPQVSTTLTEEQFVQWQALCRAAKKNSFQMLRWMIEEDLKTNKELIEAELKSSSGTGTA